MNEDFENKEEVIDIAVAEEIPTPKKRRKWYIPVIIVCGVLVLAACVFVGFKVGRTIKAAINDIGTDLEEKVESFTPFGEEAKQPENMPTIPMTDTSDISAGISEGSYILTDVSAIVEEVMPSVVSITSRALVNDNNYWNYFFGGYYHNFGFGDGESREVESGIGSGTIIGQNAEELLILTSYHVVDGCSSLYVTFNNGTAVDGNVKSASEESDIGIVAVPLKDIDQNTMDSIKLLEMSTDDVKVGEGVIVIGDALGYGQSVVTGIVSAVGREISVDGNTLTVIQTDAAINQGNSGGCVLNKYGKIIGISEAKISSSGVEGMCYAIPIKENSQLIQTLIQTDSKKDTTTPPTDAQGAYLGIYGRDIDSNMSNAYGFPQGIYVSSIVEGSGAEDAGILAGDIIIGFEGVTTLTMAELQSELADKKAGDVVMITLYRANGSRYQALEIEVTLTDRLS